MLHRQNGSTLVGSFLYVISNINLFVCLFLSHPLRYSRPGHLESKNTRGPCTIEELRMNNLFTSLYLLIYLSGTHSLCWTGSVPDIPGAGKIHSRR